MESKGGAKRAGVREESQGRWGVVRSRRDRIDRVRQERRAAVSIGAIRQGRAGMERTGKAGKDVKERKGMVRYGAQRYCRCGMERSVMAGKDRQAWRAEVGTGKGGELRKGEAGAVCRAKAVRGMVRRGEHGN